MGRKKIRLSILFTVIGLFWSPIEAAEVYSLQQLLERAENHTALKEDLDALRRSAELKLTQVHMEKWLQTLELKAFGGVVPNVNADQAVANRSANDLLFSVDSNDFENGGFSVSNLGGFGRVEVSAIQPLWTWGQISGYEEMAKANLEIAEAERDQEILKVRKLVKRAFYTLQLSEDSIRVLEEVRGKLSQAEEKVEELLIKNSENVEENDRLKIKVFMADVENRSLDAFRGRNLARSALFELTGVSGDWKPETDGLEPEPVENLGKDDIISKALRATPEIRRLEHYVQVKENERTTVRAQLFPTFFLAGELNYAVAPGRTDIKNPYLHDPFNQFNLGVALGLKQDLGFHRTKNKMDQLEAELDRLRAQKERLSSLVRIRTEEAFEKAVMAQRGIQINEKGFRAARSWLTSAGLAFNLGTASTKDILESYAAYFKARVDLLRSIYDLNMALSQLSQVSGSEVVDRLE